MSRLSYGQVELRLGDETLTLKPTLAAIQKVCRHFGSVREGLAPVANMNLDAHVVVIAAGAGLSAREIAELPAKVVDAGMINLAGPLQEYLYVLMNPSGRSADSEGEGEGKL